MIFGDCSYEESADRARSCQPIPRNGTRRPIFREIRSGPYESTKRVTREAFGAVKWRDERIVSISAAIPLLRQQIFKRPRVPPERHGTWPAALRSANANPNVWTRSLNTNVA
jgi:hypothetical protein